MLALVSALMSAVDLDIGDPILLYLIPEAREVSSAVDGVSRVSMGECSP